MVKKQEEIKPKFKIGDVVTFEDSIRYPEKAKVKTIGKIVAIHVFHGKTFRTTPANPKGNLFGYIEYSIDGQVDFVGESILFPYYEDSSE